MTDLAGRLLMRVSVLFHGSVALVFSTFRPGNGWQHQASFDDVACIDSTTALERERTSPTVASQPKSPAMYVHAKNFGVVVKAARSFRQSFKKPRFVRKQTICGHGMQGTTLELICKYMRLFDVNGDGQVDMEEFKQMIKVSLVNQISLPATC